MSGQVTGQVLKRSTVDNATDLAILVAIADTAHHDGVSFIPQGPRHDPQSIAFQSRTSVRTVERRIPQLEWNLEVEIRKAQRGKARINVYRILAGDVLFAEPQYHRLPFKLERPFSTPIEVEELRTGRQLDGETFQVRPDSLSVGNSGDDPPSEQVRPANSGGSGPALTPSLTGASKSEAPVSPGGDDDPVKTQVKELVVAFACEVGFFPASRSDWGAWSRAFKPLADAGITADEMTTRTRAYLARWNLSISPDSPVFAMTLTKYFDRVGASLERSYFGLYRWATERAWRLGDLDEAIWIVQASTRVTDEERARLVDVVREGFRAHADPSSSVLTWVETAGFALEEREWNEELNSRIHSVKATDVPEIRRRAREIRTELRGALANLRLQGVA